MIKNTVPAVGARASIVIGEEAQWGTAVDPTHLISFNSESLSASEETIMSEAIRGDRGRHELIQGSLEVSGDIEFEQSASGFGMLLRHALGDYLRLDNVDGGVHARCETALTNGKPLLVDTELGDNYIILPLAKEHSGGFPASGSFVVVDRTGTTNQLRLQGGAGSGDGFTYTSYNQSALSHVASVAAEPDAAYTADPVAVIVYPELTPDGTYRRPDFNANGGLIEYGHRRTQAKYYKAVDVDVTIDATPQPGKKLFMDPADVVVGDIVAGDYIFGFAGLADTGATVVDFTNTSAAIAELSRGAWIYEYDTTFAGVYTHHMERGRYLPEGLTVEIDRDAAVFLYSGVKVGSVNWSASAGEIVSGSFGLIGRAEYAMAELVEDALPGLDANSRTYILVTDAEAFPDPATRADMTEAVITIGERTGIRYSAKELAGAADGIGYTDADEVYKLTLVDNTELTTFYPKGSNVDCKTSRRVAAADLRKGSNTPLTAFESVIFVDGTYEEVLSAEVTLENNINTDKMGLGSRFVLAVVAEIAEVSATLTMEFDDGKHYKRFRKGDFFFLEVKCISEASDAEINNTGIPAQQYVILPRCKFDGETPDVADQSFIEHDMPVTAVVDDDYETTDIICILVNGNQYDVENAA